VQIDSRFTEEKQRNIQYLDLRSYMCLGKCICDL